MRILVWNKKQDDIKIGLSPFCPRRIYAQQFLNHRAAGPARTAAGLANAAASRPQTGCASCAWPKTPSAREGTHENAIRSRKAIGSTSLDSLPLSEDAL
jgi:hypothetical protein